MLDQGRSSAKSTFYQRTVALLVAAFSHLFRKSGGEGVGGKTCLPLGKEIYAAPRPRGALSRSGSVGAQLTSPGMPADLNPIGELVFIVHQDGWRSYPLPDREELWGRSRQLMVAMELQTHFTRNEWHYCIEPLIGRVLSLMGALPASEGVHDLMSGGLFCHSLRVSLRALRYYKEELLQANFYAQERARLLQAGIIYQGLAHDLGKILTDFQVCGEDGARWEPREEDFYDFASGHCQGSFRLAFRRGRGMSHKERQALALSLLLPRGGEFMRLCRSLTNDPEAILDGTLEVREYIAKADCMDVADQSPLRTRELHVPEYLKALLGQKILSGAFIVNEPESSCYVTDFGLLVVKDSEAHRFLTSCFDGLVCPEEKEPNDNLVNYCKSRGLFLLTGEKAVYSWYLLRLGDEICLVHGLMLRCDFTAQFPSCYCRPLGTGQQELAPILSFFAEQQLEISKFKVREERQPSVGYQVEDLVDYAPVSSLSRERALAYQRRYAQKSRLKKALNQEQAELAELYRLCKPEEISLKSEVTAQTEGHTESLSWEEDTAQAENTGAAGAADRSGASGSAGWQIQPLPSDLRTEQKVRRRSTVRSKRKTSTDHGMSSAVTAHGPADLTADSGSAAAAVCPDSVAAPKTTVLTGLTAGVDIASQAAAAASQKESPRARRKSSGTAQTRKRGAMTGVSEETGRSEATVAGDLAEAGPQQILGKEVTAGHLESAATWEAGELGAVEEHSQEQVRA